MSHPVVGQDLDRRDVLRRGLVWGGAGAVATAAASATTASAKSSGRKLTLDVACLGDSFRLALADGADPSKGDLYGSPFLVRGVIYKGGTLKPGAGFDPASKRGLGVWFCHGVLMFTPELPDVLTVQEHVLGSVGPSRFPRNQLHSNGFEPHDDKVAAARSVIGGTGRYAGAAGTVVETVLGTNTTRLPDGSNAPNLRFVFKLRG